MLPCESKLDRVLSISHPCHPPQPASMPEDRMLPICSPAMLIIAHTQQMQPLRPAGNERGKRREKSRGFVRCWCFVGLYDVLWCHMVFYGVIWGCMLLYVVICCYMLLYGVESLNGVTWNCIWCWILNFHLCWRGICRTWFPTCGRSIEASLPTVLTLV